MKLSYSNYLEAVEDLKNKLGFDDLIRKPKVGLVLGSGLGAFADLLAQTRRVSFSEIKHMPKAGVAGHDGEFVYGLTPSGVPVLAQKGRIHVYEGHDLSFVSLPIRLQAALGIEHLIITTATGSIDENYKPGDFMLIKDHINWPQVSPLKGLGEEWGTRFVDLSEVYDLETLKNVRAYTQKNHPEITLHQGVFGYVAGPHYETPAEIRALRFMGAHAVSMSVVPEAIVARQCGAKITAIASITNFGSGLKKQVIEHNHVTEAGQASAPRMIQLLNNATSLINAALGSSV